MEKNISNTVAVTEILANFIADTRSEDIPETARQRAAVALLDWIGVTLAASGYEAARLLRESAELFAGPAQANIIGINRRTDAISAALINGFTSHLLDYDDVDMQWIGHPGVTVFPAVLAAAQWSGATGREMIDSCVIGLQVQNRIGRALMPDHYERGHHSTATIGAFGAAAGTARLLGLNSDQAATALGIAGTQSAGLRLMFGSMCKPLHPGRAAANGLMAAVLARRGFTSAKEIIEAPGGFAEVLSSDFNPDCAIENLLKEWAVDVIEFKEYPSCRSTHAVINCILKARPELLNHIGDIASIEFRISDIAARIAKVENPATALEAKFSQHYCATVALLDGNVGLAQFVKGRVKDPEVIELMRKILIRGDKLVKYDAAIARVTLRSGEMADFQYYPDKNIGIDKITLAVTNKFHSLLSSGSGMSEREINNLIKRILGISRESHIDQVIESLAGDLPVYD